MSVGRNQPEATPPRFCGHPLPSPRRSDGSAWLKRSSIGARNAAGGTGFGVGHLVTDRVRRVRDPHVDRDGSAGRGRARGISQQVGQHLLQPSRLGAERLLGGLALPEIEQVIDQLTEPHDVA